MLEPKIRLRDENATERPELSFVFPVFDEEGNVGILLDDALSLGKRLGPSFEIVVVDDGSRDRSAEEIEARSLTHPEIHVVRHASNQGYGAALRSGLRAATGRWIFFSDADGQFELAELDRLLAHRDSFDVVVGFRSPRSDPLGRRLLAWVWRSLVRGVYGVSVRDVDCAFKLFRREVLDAMPIASVGAFVNTEILVRARRAGHRIHEVPVSHRPRVHGRQSGARPRVIWRALAEFRSLYREL
jgi:glycosyltransferase involved in cell wall biosynthesis